MTIHAFPTVYPELAHTEEGMTLRDYIAIQVLSVIIKQLPMDISGDCRLAYKYADQMMDVREENHE